MPFADVYHPDVPDDLSEIPRNIQDRIETAIRLRLCQSPQNYGKPLTGNLGGYWKMRVGDYRVVYKIIKNEIWIFGVINRRDVYKDIVKRLGWTP